jgi:hypothetical protein
MRAFFLFGIMHREPTQSQPVRNTGNCSFGASDPKMDGSRIPDFHPKSGMRSSPDRDCHPADHLAHRDCCLSITSNRRNPTARGIVNAHQSWWDHPIRMPQYCVHCDGIACPLIENRTASIVECFDFFLCPDLSGECRRPSPLS